MPMGNGLLDWLSSATRFRPATERGFLPEWRNLYCALG
ncbi:hypothetical protein AmDm5_1331 [Acetobacter malorum]|nr:hypothetical protein AmDm5_1331 [Acetobacter malorum]